MNTQRLTTWSLAVVCASLAGGCANYYKDYYSVERVYYVKHEGDAHLIKGTLNPPSTEGYVLIGRSNFNAPYHEEGKAMEHAKKLRAAIVCVRITPSGSASGAIPITTPQTSTTNFSGMAGGTYFSGSAHTTSYGTTLVPYSIPLYRHEASYWALERTE